MAVTVGILVMMLLTDAGGFNTGCLNNRLRFQLQPADQTVVEGEDAFFSCAYTGTSAAPLIAIAGELFSLSTLPRKYSFTGQGVRVTNVDLSMDGTSIACGFEYYDVKNGTIAECYSNTGMLHVEAKLSSPISVEDHDLVTCAARDCATFDSDSYH